VRVALLSLVLIGCATTPAAPPPTQRELLTRVLVSFTTASPQTSAPSLWLTNEDDSDCDRPDGAAHPQSSGHPLDSLAYEVFANQLVASRWARVIEAHRHNYARDLKPETRKAIVVRPDASTTVEDLCFLDEAKKRNADKLLVYQVLGADSDSVLVHLRLSDARTGVIEASRTLQATAGAVVDRSVR
jgi:hypothetical protein